MTLILVCHRQVASCYRFLFGGDIVSQVKTPPVISSLGRFQQIHNTDKINMDKHKVVPDVVDVAPAEVLKISYKNKVVDMGNEMTPTEVQNPPSELDWNASDTEYYTLCLTDPDAPSRKEPKFREWHHWLVVNIPGKQVNKGETLSEYVGSGPPKGSGLHRYVFLVYKQPEKLTFQEKRLTNRSGDHRGNFSIKKFANKYKLGNPIAGNLYQAQWDDYVPTLYKQLGH